MVCNLSIVVLTILSLICRAESACTDKLPNCADYGQSMCSDPAYTAWISDNCASFCQKCAPNIPNIPHVPTVINHASSCRDAVTNCKDYGASVCTNPDYTKWVATNCQAFCNKCSASSGGGSATQGPAVSSGSQGCVYNGQVYNEGQTWKDGCKYSCKCVTGSTGFYQCTDLCLTWKLPDVCTLNPPPPGKCCSTPSCPPGVQVQYPAGYVAQ